MWTSSFTGFSSRVKDSREEKISVSHISAEAESKKDTDSAKDKGLRTDIQSQHSPSNPVTKNETSSKSLLESSTDEGFQLRSRQRDAINFELLEPQAVNEGNVDTAVKDVTLQTSLLSEPFSASSAVNAPKKSSKGIAAQQYNLRGKLKNEELLAILRRNQEQPQAQSAVTQPIEKNKGQQESEEKTERTRTKLSVEDAKASEPQALIQYIDALLKRTEEVHPIPTAPVHAKGTHPHQYNQGFGDTRSRTNKTGRPLKEKQEAKREPQEVEPTAALHVQTTAKEEAAPPAVQKAAASKHGLPSSTTVGAASQSKQPAKPQSKQIERSLSPALTPDQQQKHNKSNYSNKVAATMHQTTGHSVLPQQRRQARPSNKVQDQALLQGLQVLGAALAPQQGTTVLAAESAGSARQGGHAAAALLKMGHSSITVTSSAVKNRLSSSGAPSNLKSAAGGGNNKDAQLGGQMEGKRVQHMSVMKGPAEQLGCILGSEASELIQVLHADAHYGEDGTRYSPPSAGPVYSPGPSTHVGHNTVTSSPSRPPSQTSPSGSHPQASPQLITRRQGGWAATDATATGRLPSPSKVLESESGRHHNIEQSNASYHAPSITTSYPSKSHSKLAPGLETAHLLQPDLTFHHVSKISSAVQTEDIWELGETGYSRWQPLGAELAQISQPQKVRPTRPEYLHSSVMKLTTCDSIGAEAAAAAAGTSAALSVHVTTSAVSELIRRFREAPPQPREQRSSTAAAAGPLRSRDVQDVQPDDDTISHWIIGTDEQLKDGNQNPGIGVSQPGYLNLDYSAASPSKMLSWRNHQTVEGATEINRSDLNIPYMMRGRRPRHSSSSSDEEEDEEMNDETGSTSLAAAETGVKLDLSKLNDVMSEEEQEGGYEVSAMSRKHQRTYLELKRLLAKRQRTPGSHDRSMIVAGERDDDRRMSSMLVRSEDATKRSPERETNGQGSTVDGLASALLNRSRSVLRERDQIQERIHAALLKIRHDGPAGPSTTSPGTVPAVSSRLSGAAASAVPRPSLHVKSHSRVPDLFPQEAAGFDRQMNRGSSTTNDVAAAAGFDRQKNRGSSTTNDVAAAAESCVVKVPISGGDLPKEQISWRDQLKALLREASVDKQTKPQAALSAHAERMQAASASSTSVHAFTETILSQQAQAAITGSSAALTSPAPLHEGSIKLSSSRVHETSDMILPSSRVQHASGDSSIRTEQYSLKLLPLQNLSHTPLSVTHPLLVPPDIDQLLALLASRFGLAPRGLVVGDTKIAYVVPEVTTAVSGQISPPVPATRRQGLADNAISSEATTGRVEGETSVVAAGALYDASKTMWHDAEEMPEKERASGSHSPLTQSSLIVAPEAAAAQGLASNDRLSAMNNAILFSPLLDVHQEGKVTTTCKTDSYTSDALYDAYQQDGPIHDERLNSPANVADTVDSATPSRRRWSISSPSSEKASDSFKSETGSGRIWKGAADTLSATAHVSAGSSPTASLPLTINELAGLQQEVSNGGTPPRSPRRRRSSQETAAPSCSPHMLGSAHSSLPSTTSLLSHTPVSTDGSSKPWSSSRKFLDRPVVMQMPQAAEGSRLPESPVMISCLVLDHHKAKVQPLQQSAPPYFGPASEEYSIRFNTDGSTRSVNGIIPQNDDDGSAADDHVAPVAFSPLLGRLLYHSVTANLFAESPFTSVATLVSSDEESDCEDASVVGARRMHAAHLETSAGSENGFEQDLEATHDENLSVNRYLRQRCHISNANRGTELHTASDSGSPTSNGPAIRVVYTSHVDDITRARASETSDAERVYQWSSGVEESVSDHYLSSSVRESCWEESGEKAAKGPKPLFEATTRWSLDTARSAQHCGGPDLHAAASGDVSGIINPLLIATTVTTSLFEIDCGNISSTAVAEDRPRQDNKDQESWWRERGRNKSRIEGASRDVDENELNTCSRAEIMSDQDYQDPSLAISMDVSLDQQTAARLVSIVASTGPAAENEMTSNNLDYAILVVQKEEGVDRALQAEVSHHQATILPNACSSSFSPDVNSDSNGPAASVHVATNGPASAHVVAANGPAASAHVVATNGPASAHVVAARRPVPFLHHKLTSSAAPTLLSATMGCHEALHDHDGTDSIRCTESATDITSRTSSETTHSEVSGLRSHGSKEGSEGVSGGGVSTDDDEGSLMSNAGGSKHAELRPFMLGGQYGCMDGRSSVHSHGSELYPVRDAMSSPASSPPWAGLPPCSITVLDEDIEDNDVQQNESGDNNPKCTERLGEEHIEELDLKEVDENQEMVDEQVLLFQETVFIPDVVDVVARSVEIVETSVDIMAEQEQQEEGRGLVEIESEHKQEEDKGVEIGGEHSWDEHFGMDYGHGPDDIAPQYVSHEVGDDKHAMRQVVQHELRQHAVLHQCTSSWASSSTLKPMQTRPTSHDSSESASRGKPGGTHRPTTPEETGEQWEQQQQQVQQYLSSSTQNQPTKTSGLLTSQSITVHASSLADLPTLYHPTSTLSSSVIVEEDVVMKLLHEKILTCVGQLRDINQRLT